DVPLNVEVWVKGKIDPPQALMLAIRAGGASPKLLGGKDNIVGARQFPDWTLLSATIPGEFLGRSGLRLMFVATQHSAAPAPLDLFIDRLKITSFESWAPLSRLGLAPPLAGDDGLYTLSGGTSMATPLVAGGAALVRQSLIAGGTSTPSAELVK